MVMLRRKLLRDLLHIRGQVFAIALVVASAVSSYVTMRGAYESLLIAQLLYYDEYAFADVFASLKRAPESVAERLRAIDGVAAVQTRVVAKVILDVPGLEEPASGLLLSLPDAGEPRLNRVRVRRGRLPIAADEILVSEGFAAENELVPGASIAAVINSRWRTLRITGIAITPEYIDESRGSDVFPDPRRFGILWMRRHPLAAAMGLDGAFNNVSFALAPGASEPEVIAAADRALARYGTLGAYGRDEQPFHRIMRDELAQDRVTSLFIPGIFLGVAALLIHLLLMRLVASQREQIAVLKAFGYNNAAIARHFAGFALMIVGAGSVVGVPIGIWLGRNLMELYTKFFRMPSLTFEVSALAIALSTGTAVIAALIGAITAVRRVASLPPAGLARDHRRLSDHRRRAHQAWSKRAHRTVGRFATAPRARAPRRAGRVHEGLRPRRRGAARERHL